MPGFMDILGNLDAHSNLILEAAVENNVPDGPFVTAYLRGIESLSSTIREAQSHEIKLFKFVGEQAGGTGKVVEKRDKGLVTPLKKAGFGNRMNPANIGAGAATPAKYAKASTAPDANWDNPQILLSTAFTLTEEYRAMPRAKAHIRNLMDQYIDTQNKINELEAAIAEVTSGKESKSGTETGDSGRGEEERGQAASSDPEEWIKAEEAALKALEAQIAERRKSKRQTTQQTATPPSRAPAQHATPNSTSPLLPQLRKGMTPSAHSPLLTTSMHSGLAMDNLSTPTPASTSTTYPASVFRRPLGKPVTAVSRAMEATRGQIKTISTAAKHSVLSNQHSPVTRLASSPNPKSSPSNRAKQPLGARTPSAAVRDRSTEDESSSSPKQNVATPPRQAEASKTPQKKASEAEERSTTPQQPVSEPLPIDQSGEAESVGASTPRASGRKVVEGVEIRSETRQAIDKIWDVFGEVMRSDEDLQDTAGKPNPAQAIRTLAKLAGSVPQPPLSPSSVSTMSNPRPLAAKVAPLTSLIILQCVAVLNILRAPGMNISKNELSDTMTAHAVAKGWDKALGQKALLGCVGRRILKIDRRGPGGGTVMFNL